MKKKKKKPAFLRVVRPQCCPNKIRLAMGPAAYCVSRTEALKFVSAILKALEDR